MTSGPGHPVTPHRPHAVTTPSDDAPFYMLACLECGNPERPLPMPFDSPAERGKWASAHTRATGHDRWRVWTEVRMTAREER